MKNVSVIIPVYNVEKYLTQCLVSAVNQTLEDIEIICIDDGSTDNSAAILDEFQKKDDRIIIIHKENSGYGSAMNKGIEIASGKYIAFLESDDFILPDMYKTLYEVAENNQLEIVKADFYEFQQKDDKIYKRYHNLSNYDNYNQIIDVSKELKSFFVIMYTWSGLYLTSFIKDNNIVHNETPGASYQDNGFWFQTMMHATRILFLDRPFYMYRQDNPDSSIHNKGKLLAFTEEYHFIHSKIDDFQGPLKDKYYSICTFFNILHNINSLYRVDTGLTKELSGIIQREFKEACERDEFDVRLYMDEFLRKLLFIVSTPELACNYIHENLNDILKWKNFIQQYDNIILYGAGNYAKRMISYIDSFRLWNRNIMYGVTDLSNASCTLEDFPIYQIKELQQYKNDALVILCVKSDTDYFTDMKEMLKELQFNNIIHAEEIFQDDLMKKIDYRLI